MHEARDDHPHKDVILDSNVLIRMLDDPLVNEKFAKMRAVNGSRMLISVRVLVEILGSSDAHHTRRCGALRELLSERSDLPVCPADHDVWKIEFGGQVSRIPDLEQPDRQVLELILTHSYDSEVQQTLRARAEDVRVSKQRFGSLHLRNRSALIQRFKASQRGNISDWIREVEDFVRNRSIPVGWIMADVATNAFGEAVTEADSYDHGITSLCACAGTFGSEDKGARDRCTLLKEGRYVRCSVRSLTEFLTSDPDPADVRPSGNDARMVERESVARMAGELVREFGLLYFTFGMLDAQLAETERRAMFGAKWFAGVLGVGVSCMVFGILMERLRHK